MGMVGKKLTGFFFTFSMDNSLAELLTSRVVGFTGHNQEWIKTISHGLRVPVVDLDEFDRVIAKVLPSKQHKHRLEHLEMILADGIMQPTIVVVGIKYQEEIDFILQKHIGSQVYHVLGEQHTPASDAYSLPQLDVCCNMLGAQIVQNIII